MNNLQFVMERSQKIMSYITEININSSLVFLAGSILEGFGNATSDIDVYIICDNTDNKVMNLTNHNGESIFPSEHCLTKNVTEDGVRYDFEYWNWGDFNLLISKLNNLDFKTSHYIDRLKSEEYDLLHRLKWARPIHNEVLFDKIHTNIQFENLNFYRAVVQSEIYSGAVEDIQGACISGDFGSAFFMVRGLINIVMNGYLGIYGETNPNNKWIYRKLKKYEEGSSDKELMKLYLKLQTHPFHNDTVQEYIREAMQFCQKYNLKTQDLLRQKQI